MIKLKKNDDNQFYFIVTAKNGQTLVTSEMYTRKEKAKSSAEALVALLKSDVEIGDFSK